MPARLVNQTPNRRPQGSLTNEQAAQKIVELLSDAVTQCSRVHRRCKRIINNAPGDVTAVTAAMNPELRSEVAQMMAKLKAIVDEHQV